MLQRFLGEMRKFAIIAAFLFVFLGAFATYRRLILRQYEIDYFQYGYSFIEALVLGKVVLLGDMFHLGDRFGSKPLIVPTIYRTFMFSLLVLAFAILEEFVKGLIHGETVAQIAGTIAAVTGPQIGAKMIVMFIAFIPMFAIWEISDLFEPGKLFQLFFERRNLPGNELPEITASARQG